MIGSTSRQASLFCFAFAKEVMAITDDVLDPLDELLNDASLIDLAAQALAKRCTRSSRPSAGGSVARYRAGVVLGVG